MIVCRVWRHTSPISVLVRLIRAECIIIICIVFFLTFYLIILCVHDHQAFIFFHVVQSGVYLFLNSEEAKIYVPIYHVNQLCTVFRLSLSLSLPSLPEHLLLSNLVSTLSLSHHSVFYSLCLAPQKLLVKKEDCYSEQAKERKRWVFLL